MESPPNDYHMVEQAFMPYSPVFKQTQLSRDRFSQEDVKIWLDTATVSSSQNYASYQIKGTSVVVLSSFEVELIESLFMVRDKRNVLISFLEAHPFMTTLLIEAYKHMRQYFSRNTIFLQVVTDPEEQGAEQLVASIAVDTNPDEALDILVTFDKTWWLTAQRQTQGALCITLEF